MSEGGREGERERGREGLEGGREEGREGGNYPVREDCIITCM